MRYYPASVVGVRYEGRDRYVRKNLRIGDRLSFKPEPDNPYSSEAVAVYHRTTKIGYLPSENLWIRESISEGDTHEVTATELVVNDEGQLAVVRIEVGVIDAPYEPPAPSASQIVLSELGGELAVLISIAKADARLVKSERELILRYAKERAHDKNLTFDVEVASRVDRWLRKQDPTDVEVRLHLYRIAQSDRTALEAIYEVSEIVAESDQKTDKREQQRLTEVRSLMQKILAEM